MGDFTFCFFYSSINKFTKRALTLLMLGFLFVTNSLNAQISYCTNCSGTTAACEDPTTNPNNNPDLITSCGEMDIILVLDESNSINTADEIRSVKEGTLTFLNALSCTGTRVAIVEFATTARIVTDFRTVDNQYLADVTDYFEGTRNTNINNQNFRDISGQEGATNWQAAMLAVDELNVPDIILFFTDGVPTAYSKGLNPTKNSATSFCGNGSSTQRPEIANPVKLANKLKDEGAHIFMLGVDGATVDTLKKMAGSTEMIPGGANNLGNSDYMVEDAFSGLAKCFVALVTGVCPFESEVTHTNYCEGSTQGSVDIFVPSKFLPFEYRYYDDLTNTLLGSGSSMNSPLKIEALTEGAYRVEVGVSSKEDTCVRTASFFFEMQQVAPPTITYTLTDVGCFIESDGIIDINVSGGMLPFAYSWTTIDGSGLQPTDEDQYNLSAGSYEVIVTDKNGCVSSEIITLNDAENLEAHAGIDKTLPACNENSSLTLEGSSSEMGSHITYSWNTLDGQILSGDDTLSPIVTTAGLYTLTVTNTATGCSSSDEVRVNAEIPPNAGFDKHKRVCQGTIVDLRALVSSTEGSFSLVNATEGLSGDYFDTTGLIGNHEIKYTVAGSGSCSTDIAIIAITISENRIDSICQAIDADFCDPNANPFYNFYWHAMREVSGSAFFSQNADHKLTFTQFNNGTALIKGSTQQNGCSAELYIFLEDKKDFIAWSADGGNFKAQGCAGTIKEQMQYYLIDSAKSYIKTTGTCVEEGTFLISQRPDPNDMSTPNLGVHVGPGGALWDSNQAAEGLAGWAWMGPEGDEQRWTIDFNFLLDCNNQLSCSDLTILNCEIDATVKQVSCFGANDGSATVNVTGGLPPYSYLWSSGETAKTAVALVAGTHTVTITDAENTTTSSSVTINEPTILECHASSIQQVSANAIADGSAKVFVNGGNQGYRYLWDNGETTQKAIALNTGSHNVIVTDANGCIAECWVAITKQEILVCEATGTAVSCKGGADGTAIATATGGMTPYAFSWSTGANTQAIDGLPAGSYSVTITDANQNVTHAQIQINEPLEILACQAIVIENVSVYGGSDAKVNSLVNGGTAPYSYAWDNGEITDTALFLTAGEHSVTVSDANGCKTNCLVLITEPEPLPVEVCDGIDTNNNGAIDEGFADTDGDGIADCVDIEECDGKDNDGDGEIDEGLLCDDPNSSCKSAFARHEINNSCFIDDGFNQWGWTNYFKQEENYVLNLYTGASNCELDKAEKTGEAHFDYHNGFVAVSILLEPGFEMTAAHLYIGSEAYPLDNNQPTIAPDKYQFKEQTLNNVVTYTFDTIDVRAFTSGFYGIVHVNTCKNTNDKAKNEGTTVIAYPMTFNNTINLDIDISYHAFIEIGIFDVNGRMIMPLKRKEVNAGLNTLNFHVSSIASDVYFLIIDTGKEKITKKIISQ